jgi:pimeloyl-ACP methyl ester carboxylesterase
MEMQALKVTRGSSVWGAAFVAASISASTGCTETSPDTPLAPDVPCIDSEQDVYGAPPANASMEKGAILRCAPYKTLSRADLEKQVREMGGDAKPTAGYSGGPFSSGARLYKVQYRTERGTNPPTPGYGVALVMLPDNPTANKLPLVVAAHGSRGQASLCAPSRYSPEGEYVRGDFDALTFPFVGFGFPVIAPDLAGYSNYGAAGNPPSAYSNAQDVGRSVLDASRALKKFIASRAADQVVLAGHSQGGHTALASLALSQTYGAAAPIRATVTYAPLWLSQRWGGLFALEQQFPLGSSGALPVSIWYHYTTGELLDGPGGGLLPFKKDVQDAIKKFVDGSCWAASYPVLAENGRRVASDFFDGAFISAVSQSAALGEPCPTSSPERQQLCEKWIARYKADRPKFEGDAAKVPVLVAIGEKDTTIPIDRLKCATDNLSASKVPVSYCVHPDADHGGIVRAEAEYVVQWVANQTLGRPVSAQCPSTSVEFKDKTTNQPITCAPIPPND